MVTFSPFRVRVFRYFWFAGLKFPHQSSIWIWRIKIWKYIQKKYLFAFAPFGAPENLWCHPMSIISILQILMALCPTPIGSRDGRELLNITVFKRLRQVSNQFWWFLIQPHYWFTAAACFFIGPNIRSIS